nr:(2Fe-2S)-binding protein [Desulfobacterales bacterium]
MTEHLIINSRKTAFTSGQTILEVARANQIPIPTICYLKGASTTGRCGICVVEIAGENGLVSSCSTIAESSMKIITESEKVIQERKTILAKLLSSGNHNCAISGSSEGEWSDFQLKVS